MSKLSALVWHGLAAVLLIPGLLTAQEVLQPQVTDKPTDIGTVEVLTDTQGIDLVPYLNQVIKTVRDIWFRSIPERVDSPVRMRGEVAIEFGIKRNGRVEGMKLVQPSGNVMLDRAAWTGISYSSPLRPLPDEFKGDHLPLRIRFYYNRPKESHKR
jgi:TonB family protein